MGADTAITHLSAIELSKQLAAGALTVLESAEAFLAEAEAREDEVRAWAFLDRDHVLQQAKMLDAYRGTGCPLGPLHGIPVGLKDIIDTAKVPTGNGAVQDRGRVPTEDATIVRQLKGAGAIIMGKTTTTELAYLHPSNTRNPRNTAHTPGGSSAGSAAAVSAGMVPLAIGTQTGGSVIRPASYCGVVGYKPTFGAIPRTGILTQSPSLDTVGVFARSVEDAAFLADTLFQNDPRDRATAPAPHPRLCITALSDVPVKPTFALVRTPFWPQAESQMRYAMEELAALLGQQCFDAELPAPFEHAQKIRETINHAEMSKYYYRYGSRSTDSISDTLARAMALGGAIPARDYISALDWPDVLNVGLEEIFDRCDAILTPSAPGPAPCGLESTGDSIFNGLWTLCGTPAVSLPIFKSESGMPMGVQVVGRRGNDARLLRTARWLASFVTNH
ncbi:amidase [Phyllobacterium sp. K27]